MQFYCVKSSLSFQFLTVILIKSNVNFGSAFRGILKLNSAKSYSTDSMSVLNVAEKNDVAKHIAGYLSRGTCRRREGFSKFNKIYEFECELQGRQRKMIMTSVSGHLLNHGFVGHYRKWSSCNPLDLFDCPVEKFCPEDYQPIQRTLEREVRGCNTLVIWTDCDREGENIGFEIISVCTAIKPNLTIYRAKFSEITAQSAWRALNTLGRPNERISQAVDVRAELDLRIGAAFTRFQTLRLQRVFPESLANNIISYGSCQFPTLGFVVERYKAIERFIPEQFWKIKASHDVDDVKVDFTWCRVRLFDEMAVRVLYERCLENPTATVESVVSKPKSKWRPLPLDTVEFEKLASRKLRLNVKDAMATAEKLYTKGLISYPRTETNIFPANMDLAGLVEQQTGNRHWGDFARRVLEDGPNPRQGKKTDQAHPPIHPTKAAEGLQGTEAKVYEFVVRHFLACVSKDAQGHETIVHIDINGEKFVGSGLMILARNYLDVYPYDGWSNRQMHVYQQGQTFRPTSLDMADGETAPPKLLTEADLIALMEKHGIGTDATHAEHIDKIKTRAYVGLENEIYFVPGHLGIGLVDGYDDMGFNMSKPHLRAELEADLVRISNGEKQPDVVLAEQIAKYREVFRLANEQAEKIDAALATYLNTRPVAVAANNQSVASIAKCSRCQCGVTVRQRPNNGDWYLGCLGFPQCRSSLWFPANVVGVEVQNSTCPTCGPEVRQLKLVFQPGTMAPWYPNTHVGCVNGCDTRLLEMLDIQSLAAATGQERAPAQAPAPPTQAARATPDHSRGSSGYSSLHTASDSRPSTVNRFSCGFSDNPSRPSLNSRTQFQNSFQDNNGDDNNQRGSSWNNRGDNNRQSWGNNNFNDGPDEICCSCGIPARRLKVMKESVNKGRFFYACPKPQGEERCNFFQWADDDDGGGGGGGGGGDDRWGGGGGGGTGRGKKRPQPPSQFRARGFDSGPPASQVPKKRAAPTKGKQRLCGICKEPGHTRVNCPMA